MDLKQYETISASVFAEYIIADLNEYFNIRIDLIINNDMLTYKKKKSKIIEKLIESAFSDSIELQINCDQALLASIKDGTNIEPNLYLPMKDFGFIQGLKNQQIHGYVYNLVERLKEISKCKTPQQMAGEIIISSLFSVGASMAMGTISGLIAGATLSTALIAGISSIGVGTAVVIVSIVLIGLLFYLFVDNPKKIVGLVVNNTDENMYVWNWRNGMGGGTNSHLYMKHGHMVNFPEDSDQGDLRKQKVQINKRIIIDQKGSDNAFAMGIFYADRNVGVRGSEGTFVLTSADGRSMIIANQFAVPYVNDNGTNIQLLTSDRIDIKQINDSLYNGRSIYNDRRFGKIRLTAKMNCKRGGTVASISTISYA